MTPRKDRRVIARVAVIGVMLAAAVPVAHALQLEPRMMFETGTGVGAVPVAGMTGGSPAGMRGGPGAVQGGGPEGMRGGPPPLLPPFIRLSSAQQDRLFELRHAQEPALRAQMQELHSAHAQLHTLAMADVYDEASVRQVAARASQASGELALMHVRLRHAAFLLLTPEQRKRWEQCRPSTEGAPPPECLGPSR